MLHKDILRPFDGCFTLISLTGGVKQKTGGDIGEIVVAGIAIIKARKEKDKQGHGADKVGIGQRLRRFVIHIEINQAKYNKGEVGHKQKKIKQQDNTQLRFYKIIQIIFHTLAPNHQE